MTGFYEGVIQCFLSEFDEARLTYVFHSPSLEQILISGHSTTSSLATMDSVTRSLHVVIALLLDLILTHIRTTRVDNPHMDWCWCPWGISEGDLIISGEILVPGSAGETFAGLSAIRKSTKGSNQRIAYDLDLGNDMFIQVNANTKAGMLFVIVNRAFADSKGWVQHLRKANLCFLVTESPTWLVIGILMGRSGKSTMLIRLFQGMNRHPQYDTPRAVNTWPKWRSPTSAAVS